MGESWGRDCLGIVRMHALLANSSFLSKGRAGPRDVYLSYPSLVLWSFYLRPSVAVSEKSVTLARWRSVKEHAVRHWKGNNVETSLKRYVRRHSPSAVR